MTIKLFLNLKWGKHFILTHFSPIFQFQSPWTQDVNWTYVRRSKDVQDVLCTFNLRPVSRRIPPENTIKPKVFWRFQGVWTWSIEWKWVSKRNKTKERCYVKLRCMLIFFNLYPTLTFFYFCYLFWWPMLAYRPQHSCFKISQNL